MHELSSFFLIVFIGVFFSMVRRRLHLPWVVALILGGVLVGPFGLGLLEVTPVTSFLADIGFIFLMFMAGLETHTSAFEGFKGKLLLLSFVNGIIPFVVGVSIGVFFGYGWLTSLLVGVIFIASSIAVVIPSLEVRNLLHTRLGQSVVMTSVIQDITSLGLLSVLLQSYSPVTSLPLVVFYPVVIATIIGFRYALPRVMVLISGMTKDTRDVFQQEFRSMFLVLLGTVVVFELLGLHPIIGGFFAGFVLAGTVTDAALKEKLRTISYGIFIPMSFVIVGLRTDLSVFTSDAHGWPIIVAVIAGSMLSKLGSGYLGARMVGFPPDQSLLFSISSIASLSTTLAVTFAAFTLGILDQTLVTAMVTLSVVSVLVSPTLMDIFGKRIKSSLSLTERIRASADFPPVESLKN